MRLTSNSFSSEDDANSFDSLISDNSYSNPWRDLSFGSVLTFDQFSSGTASLNHADEKDADHAHILPIGFYSQDGGGGPQFFQNAGDRGQGDVNGKPSFTIEQAAAQITRSGANWGASGVTVTYAYRESVPQSELDDIEIGGFTTFNATQIVQTELSLQSWSDVANINFQRVGSGTIGATAFSNNATMLFANYSTGADGAAAFAYFPGSTSTTAYAGNSWYNSSLSYNATPALWEYGRQVLVHEIGHNLGLSHPGTYNAGAGVSITYAANAEYYEDSRMHTVMSYFGSTNTGGNLPGFASAPLLDDIAAVQRLYGANYDTRSGDTTYGFNSTAARDFYAATVSVVPVFAVWDGGGFDTLDFSGYSANQIIDLGEGNFSNIGGFAGNVSIALNAIIEKAIGGSGSDTLYAGYHAYTESFAQTYSGYSSTANIITKAQGTVNNSQGSAVSLDGFFTLASNVNVDNSTTIPHAQVQATGHGGLEYYSFAVAQAGTTGYFDIDFTSTGLDAYLYLYDASGALIFSNDDSAIDTGSNKTQDSQFSYTFGASGTYYIVVNEWNAAGFGSGVPVGETYTLHTSLELPDHIVIRSYQGYELDGGAGADTLHDSAGDDTLTGGSGADVFVFTHLTGIDTITDFEDGSDLIDFTGMASQVMQLDGRGGYQADLQDSIGFVQNGSDAWVVILRHEKAPVYTIDDALIIIENTQIADLSLANDFLFA